MSYTKNTWVTGDVITAEKMNNIENGIELLANTSPGYPDGNVGLIGTKLTQNEVKTNDTLFEKPIYTKTIMFNTSIRNQIFEVDHNITDAEYLWIDMQNSFMYASSGLTYPLSFYRYNGSSGSAVQVSATKTTVRLDVVDGWDEIWTKVITVRYTKTTD